MHILKKLRHSDEHWKKVELHNNHTSFLCMPMTIIGLPYLLANVHKVLFTDYEGFKKTIKVGEDQNCIYVQLPISSTRFVSLDAIRK